MRGIVGFSLCELWSFVTFTIASVPIPTFYVASFPFVLVKGWFRRCIVGENQEDTNRRANGFTNNILHVHHLIYFMSNGAECLLNVHKIGETYIKLSLRNDNGVL